MTASMHGRIDAIARVWVALGMFALVPAASAQTVLTGSSGSSIEYLFGASPPPPVLLQVFGSGLPIGETAATLTGSPVVISASFADTSISSVISSALCGSGCVEETLVGSGSFSVSTTSISGTLGNGEILAAPGTTAAVIQFTLAPTGGGAPEYLILSGTTTSAIALCDPGQFGGCFAPPSGSTGTAINTFTLGTGFTATVSTSPIGGVPPPPPPGNRQVYLNSANLGDSPVIWTTPANPWTLSSGTATTPPQTGDDVFVTNRSGANASGPTVIDYNVPSLSLNSLTIDGHSSSDLGMYLSQAANQLTSVSETIGTTGPAAYAQIGGTNTVTGALTVNTYGTYLLQGGALNAGTITVNSGGTFAFNGGTASFSTFNLNGGAMTASGDEVLDAAGATSTSYTFSQTAGINTVAGSLTMGNSSGAFAGYIMQGSGTLTAANEWIGTAGAATAIFSQSGATSTNTVSGTLGLGIGANAYGAYNLLAGSLSTASELIGQGGTGVVTQAGGSHTVNGLLVLGSDYGSTGAYSLQGGALSATAEQLGGTVSNGPTGALLEGGSATVTQSGGTNTIGPSGGPGLTYSFNIQPSDLALIFGATQTVSVNAGTLGIGVNGSYDLQGGVLTVPTIENSGTFRFDGGTANYAEFVNTGVVTAMGNLYLGTVASPTVTFTQEQWSPSNPSNTVNGVLVLAADRGSTAVFNFGGSQLATGAYQGFTLDGGTLAAAAEVIGGYGTGTFTQASGTNTVGPAGGAALPYSVTGPSGPTVQSIAAGEVLINAGGTYNLQGGTLVAASMVVAAGGAFTQSATTSTNAGIGAGTAYGTVTNAGTFTVADGTFTSGGNFTNSGRLTIDSGAVLNVPNYLQLQGATGVINHGTLDPGSIEILGGAFGGSGTLIGNVSVSNGATLNVGGPNSGLLQIQGSFTQMGGAIDFLIDSSGASRLEFDSADGVSIADADIVFDFADSAAETAFLGSEAFNLDAFFLDSAGLTGAGLAGLFEGTGDTFQYEFGAGPIADLGFDPTTGDLNIVVPTNVPEPSTLGLALPGLGLLGLVLYRRRPRSTDFARAA